MKKTSTLKLDKDFKIVVDSQNWIVNQRKTRLSGKDEGKDWWDEEAYCHDLPDSLKAVMRIKSANGRPIDFVQGHLRWYDSTIHSLCDRIYRMEAELREAVDINGVLIHPDSKRGSY